MRRFIHFLTYLAMGLCGFSFLGRFIPLADSLIIFHPFIWIFAGLGSFFFPTGIKEASRIVLILLAYPFLMMFDQSTDFETPKLRVYQHNLLFTNIAPDLQMVVKRLEPDVLTLQEIKTARETVTGLEGYPHQQICNFATVGDVGVVSKTKFIDSGCSTGDYRGFAWAQIESPEGHPVTIVSMHLHWPFPYQQRGQLDDILPQIELLPQPIVLAGDLNQVQWSYAAKTISEATQAPVLRGLRFTLVRPPIFLPIDQAFGHGHHKVTVLDRYGSDHNALLVDFESWPLN